MTGWYGQLLLGRQTAFGRFCHLWRVNLRTIVYVDGYNLYYGLLRGTSNKWLDLVSLFKNYVLNNEVNLIEVRYYTAPVLGRMCDDPDSPARQRRYLQALKKLYPDELKIIEGKISPSTPVRRLVSPIEGFPDTQKVKVHDFEEKKSDVNIATDIITGAWTNAYEQAVLCSNDTDLEGALLAVRLHHPNLRLGLVAPIQNPRHIASDLKKAVHWSKVLSHAHIENSQLPNRIPASSLTRPEAWRSSE